MNKIIKQYNGFASRCLLLASFLVVSLVASAQKNVMKIKDFYITPGGSVTVELELDNETKISSLQFDMTVPEGLTPSAFTKVTTRISRSSHTTFFNPITVEDEQIYRGGFLTNAADMSKSAIAGNSGAFATLTFTASPDFKGGTIALKNIVASNGTLAGTGVDTTVEIPDSKTNASIYVGTLSVPESVTLEEEGNAVLSIGLENVIEVTMLQMDVKLPEGVEKDGNDDQCFIYNDDRLSLNTAIASNILADGTCRIVISSLTNDAFAGTAGELFGLKLKANGFKESGKIEIKNIVAANTDARSYIIDPVSVNLEFKAVPKFDDPTQDGLWNTADIDAVINAVLSGLDDKVYDINADGKITTKDIDDIIEIVLNK